MMHFLAENKEAFASVASIVSAIGVVVSAATFFAAASRYRASQIWKTNELISKEMKEFIEDKNVREVIGILDYPRKTFVAKSGLQDITITVYHSDELMPEEEDKNYHVSLPKALRVGSERVINQSATDIEKNRFKIEEEILRDKIDLYLNSLERFSILASSNLFSYRKLYEFLRYHIDILNDLKPHSFGYHEELYKYMIWYNYDLSIRLLRSYRRSDRASDFWQRAYAFKAEADQQRLENSTQ